MSSPCIETRVGEQSVRPLFIKKVPGKGKEKLEKIVSSVIMAVV